MKISILSVFPNLYDSFLSTSLVSKAQERGLVSINNESFFSYVKPKERIDAPIYGHGSGMVIRPDVIEHAIEDNLQKHGPSFRIFFSPQGKKLNQKLLSDLAQKIQKVGHALLIAGRYEGMDARVEEVYADEIISVGDFVVMGGDIPAMLFLEGLLRLIPGVVGKQESVEEESFSGPFVDYPVFAPPVAWKAKVVPEVLRSGNHAEIKKWRMNEAAKKTVLHHFEWLRCHDLTDKQKELAKKYMPPHYVALMHGDVMISDDKKIGTTSVTSIDIHDIARACKTYDIKNYFIVTPLADQQKIVRTLLDFWQTGVGIDYNPHRHQAVSLVNIQNSLDEAIAAIEEKEKVKPILIATSAREFEHEPLISFFDQGEVWAAQRPVLLIFGTGRGLSEDLLRRCDYLLVPIKGFSEFNHLSVRSAVGIALDRWLGIQIKK